MDKAQNDVYDQDKDFIDAGENIAKKNQERIKGVRGGFSGTSKKFQFSKGSRAFLLIILICGLSIASVFLWKNWHNNQETSLRNHDRSIRNTLPSLKLITPKSFVTEPNPKEIIMEKEKKIDNNEPYIDQALLAREAIKKRKLSPSLRNTGENTNNEAIQLSANQTNEKFSTEENELQNKLHPLRLNPSVAGKITNPNYTLTQGMMIDCQLETKMITTQPGMASCYATRNIYSTNGQVVLIDRGSKIVGNYQGGMQQGQARIFVLWTRIETPKGIVINLDSPGSGPLGESGLGGDVDTHFWKRFGGAIMMSLIGDLGEYTSNKGNKGGGTKIQFSNTTQGMQQASVEALKNSINIPPTLYKNQGERISIFVARDLDFSKVYELNTE